WRSAQEVELLEVVVVPVVRPGPPWHAAAGAAVGGSRSPAVRSVFLVLLLSSGFRFLRLGLVQLGLDLLALLGGQRRDVGQRVERGLDVGIHRAREVAGDHMPPREVALGDALHDDLPLRRALARQNARLHRFDLLVGQPLRVARTLLAQFRRGVLDLLDPPVGGFDRLVEPAPQRVQVGQVDPAVIRHSTTPTVLGEGTAPSRRPRAPAGPSRHHVLCVPRHSAAAYLKSRPYLTSPEPSFLMYGRSSSLTYGPWTGV